MSARRVAAILTKDLREAVRDGRILILLLLPIGLAVFYDSTLSDEERPETTVAIVDQPRSGLAGELRKAAQGGVDLTVRSARDERAARRLVDDGDADFAVLSRGAPRAGEPARAEILLPEDAEPTELSVVALVEDAVTAAAGRTPPSEVRTRRLEVDSSDQLPGEAVDQATILVVISIVMLLGFVALVVVPIQTAEEIGTGTFGALRLAATGPEILTAKALCGMLYAIVGTAITLYVTGVEVHDPLRLYGGALALAISCVGFGLLLGFTSGNANQINTYGGFLVMPVIAVAVAVLLVDSGPFGLLLDVLPFSQGARLLFDGVTPDEPFETGAVAWLVLAAWGLIGFAVLTRVATRREA